GRWNNVLKSLYKTIRMCIGRNCNMKRIKSINIRRGKMHFQQLKETSATVGIKDEVLIPRPTSLSNRPSRPEMHRLVRECIFLMDFEPFTTSVNRQLPRKPEV